MKKKILVVDDEPSIRTSLTSIFDHKGFSSSQAENAQEARDLIQSPSSTGFDVILLDVCLPDVHGLDFLEELSAIAKESQIIVITGHGSVPQSVEAMKKGAVDYVLKPFNLDEILLRIEKALQARSLKEEVGFLKEKVYGDWDKKYVQGPNKKMKKVYEMIDIIATSNSSTVFIHGETGTGKEVIARRVHALSDRSQKPFVEVNATALTTELLESELFGHEVGAFTGATKTKKGLFEVANQGTLFLDEIGDMDLSMQAKILRALQERSIRRVGGVENIEVDIRLITATNRDLAKAVQEGTFREDLYYRLMVLPIELPPLRERPDDIETLATHFIQQFNKEFKRDIQGIEKEALEALKSYPWPGNVREVRNFLERTVLLECRSNTLKLTDLKLSESSSHRLGGEFAEKEMPHGVSLLRAPLIGQNISLEEVEKAHIQGVLEKTNGNKNQAAQILEIDRTTLYNKLKKYQKQKDLETQS